MFVGQYLVFQLSNQFSNINVYQSYSVTSAIEYQNNNKKHNTKIKKFKILLHLLNNNSFLHQEFPS